MDYEDHEEKIFDTRSIESPIWTGLDEWLPLWQEEA